MSNRRQALSWPAAPNAGWLAGARPLARGGNLLLGLALLLLGACAQYAPRGIGVGTPQADVIERMGPPSGEHASRVGARRLEFARGPAGLHTYMIDVGGDGRVVSIEQVLDEAHFQAVSAGLDRVSLLSQLGRPTRIVDARADQSWWYWRFDDIFCRWFTVTLDAAGTVIDTGYAPDPRCEDLIDGHAR